jgi:hypothetical protein
LNSPLEDKNPADKLKQLTGLVDNVFQLMPSGKYMVGRDLGRLGPTALLDEFPRIRLQKI